MKGEILEKISVRGIKELRQKLAQQKRTMLI